MGNLKMPSSSFTPPHTLNVPNKTAHGGWRGERTNEWIDRQLIEKQNTLMLLNIIEENLGLWFKPQATAVDVPWAKLLTIHVLINTRKVSGFNQTYLTRLISLCYSKITSEHESVPMVHLSEIWDKVSHDRLDWAICSKLEPAARR